MINEKIFNNKISELGNNSGNNILKVIALIKDKYNLNNSYYFILDSFITKLGLGFSNMSVLNKNDKVIGYSPRLIFYSDNIFGLKAETKILSLEIMDSKSSSALLAKELIYQIMRFDEIENFIKNKI
ncbi:hypothetical protein GSF70_02795 [Flavobacteriaceae bacterium W22]|nr:hypothetical protein [Flavobacteriaceae bacterium W22]